MNSFSGVERALDVGVRAAVRAARCAAARSSSRRCSGTATRRRCGRRARRKEATTIATSRSPIFRRSSSRSDWIERMRARPARAARRAPRAIRRRSTRSATYDVDVLTASPRSPTTSSRSRARSGDAKAAANWVMGEVLAALKTTGQTIAHFRVRPADLAALLDLVRDGVVSHTRRQADLRAMVADRRSAGADRRARGAAQGRTTTRSSRLDRRGLRRASGRGGSASAAARRSCRACWSARDEEIEGQRRPEARQSVAGGARRSVERRVERRARSRSVDAGIPKWCSRLVAQRALRRLRAARRAAPASPAAAPRRPTDRAGTAPTRSMRRRSRR